MDKAKDSRIRKLRKERKLSGTAVAQRMNITPQYYYDIEKGERRLTAELASNLADILNTTVDYLLGKTDVNLYDWVTSPSEAFVAEDPVLYNAKNPSSSANEKEFEFVSKIDLSDDELIKLFTIEVDGRPLSEKEMRKIIAQVRLDRQFENN